MSILSSGNQEKNWNCFLICLPTASSASLNNSDCHNVLLKSTNNYPAGKDKYQNIGSAPKDDKSTESIQNIDCYVEAELTHNPNLDYVSTLSQHNLQFKLVYCIQFREIFYK